MMEWLKLKKIVKNESGQILLLVLVLLVLGALLLVPLLSLTGTDLKSGQLYEYKVTDYYAADSGVEDALWQIKYDHLEDTGLFTTTYERYGFDVLGNDYGYQTALNVNSRAVNVNIANVWVPKDVDPAGYDLEAMVEGTKLVVTGSTTSLSSFRINISYNRDLSDAPLLVTSIGIWLPPGFYYDRTDGDTCGLESNPVGPYRPTLPPEISEHCGGTVVVWHFPSNPLFVSFPGVIQQGNTYKLDINMTFHATQEGRKPDAIAWLTTSGVSDIPFGWDADVRVFKIRSVAAGGTEVEAYAAKTELRKLARTIPGDYKAIGNSLLTDDDPDGNHIRDTWHTPSDSTASGIPLDAEIAAAYLYWSGWKQGQPGTISGTSMSPLNPETCVDFDNWTTSSGAWSSDGTKFIGHYISGGDPARYLTLKNPVSLSGFSNLTVTWQHGEDGSLELADKLRYQVSWDNGTTWSGLTTAFEDDRAAEYPTTYTGTYSVAPVAPYNFLFRFYLADFTGSDEYCFLDDVIITGTKFSDDFANLNNWTAGSAWDSNSGAARGWTYNKSSPGRYLLLKNAINVTGLSNLTVTWQHGEQGDLELTDKLQYQVSWNNGTTWGGLTTAFEDDRVAQYPTTYTGTYNGTPVAPYNFLIRFYLADFAGNPEYCYVDNLSVKVTLFTDSCVDFTNWNVVSSAWQIDSGTRFGAHYLTGGDPARYLSLTNSINLSAYSTQQIVVSWDQYCAGTLEPEDALYVSFSDDDGTFWSDSNVGTDGYPAAMDDVQAGGFSTTAKTFSITIPSNYLTDRFKMRFYINSFADSGEYCYIDNITLKRWPASFRDEASYAPPDAYSNWTSNGAWTSYYNSYFVGHAAGNGYIGLTSSMDLSDIADRLVIATWQQAESGTLEAADKLKYQFTGDGGTTWSLLDSGLAFEDDLSADNTFYDFDGDSDGVPGVIIPTEYLTDEFEIRFYLEGYAEAGEYCYINNIMIYSTPLNADTTVMLEIDGQQVYYDNDGVPRQGSQLINADRAQVLINNGSGSPPAYFGYGYSCYTDITALVRAFSAEGPNHNRPGNAEYTVGDVDADEDYQLSYAGWSIVLIYTSMATQGHLLYIYDNFTFAPDNTNIDFDRDGDPGGYISGFIVPDKITGEVYSAQITVFVGEGDEFIEGDYIELNNTKLWDGITCGGNSSGTPTNVWNSLSTGMSYDGVDVDTFRVRWDSYLLNPGDIAAQIDLQTGNDNWNLIFIIISFRSETTMGGTITYLIK